MATGPGAYGMGTGIGNRRGRGYGGIFTPSTKKDAVTPKDRPGYKPTTSFKEMMDESGLPGAVWNQIGQTLSWAVQGRNQAQDAFEGLVGGVGELPVIKDVRESFGALGEGVGDFFGGISDEQQSSFSPEAERAKIFEQTQSTLSAVSPMLDFLEATDGVPMDAASKYKAEQARLGIEQQMRDLDAQLQQQELNLQMQNQLYDVYEATAFGGNVVPGADRQTEILNNWLDQGGESTGIRPEVATAISQIMADPSLDGEEKMARVDFLMDQVSTQQQIRMQINDVTQNLTDLETLKAMPDAELLVNMGESPEYVTPAFSYLQDPEVAADPAMRYNTNVANYVEDVLGTAGVAIPAEQEEGFANWLFSLGGAEEINWEDPTISGQLRNFATSLKVDPALLRDSVTAANRSAAKTEEDWESALTKQRLEPGSEEMAIAIFQVASMLNWPPEMAAKVAESQGLHMLIKAKSDGKAGGTRGGTQMGLGGLSEQAYQKMGIDPANLGSMDVEIGALLRYIQENFEGDPDAALAYYYTTGEWGL